MARLPSWLPNAAELSVWRLIGFGLAAVSAVVLGFLVCSPPLAGILVRRYGYFSLLLTVFWWLIQSWRTRAGWQPGWESWPRREFWSVGAAIAGLTVVAWCVFPYSYKVLYDEMVLQMTARNLHFLREVGTMVRGYPIEGVLTPLDIYVDKRPYFFAFLVSLVHDLTGYRESNAFFFNSALYPLALGLFYAVARRLMPARLACIAMIVFAASPLLAQNANGAGMDLLNLVMVLVGTWVAIHYLEQPDEPRLAWLLLTSVLLAESRYESLLFIGSVALVVLEGWRRADRVILPWTAVATPLLLVPSALHFSYLSGTPILWELKDGADARFGAEFVAENLRHAWSFFANLTPVLLNSWFASLIGFGAMGVLLCRMVRKWRQLPRLAPGVAAVGLMSLTVLGNTALLMAYYWGQLDDPIVGRLSLPLAAIMALAVGLVLVEWERGGRTGAGWVAGAALVAYVGWGLPAAAYNGRVNQLAEEIGWEGDQVAQMPPKSRLVITNKSTLSWLLQGIPAISINRVNDVSADSLRFHLAHGTFEEVLVTQRLRPVSEAGGFFIDPRDRLPARFELKTIEERMLGGRLVRISRLTRIGPAPARPAVPPESAETIAAPAPAAVAVPATPTRST